MLARFRRATGAQVRYTSAHGHVREVLDARLRAGTRTGRRPAAAAGPARARTPGAATRAARRRPRAPWSSSTTRRCGSNWRSSDGRLYGVWFKAADKSLVWYDVGAFERAGVVPPDDSAGCSASRASLRPRGIVPFSVGGADAWTLTDWFENLYLRLAGPARYDAAGRPPAAVDRPEVTRTLRVMRSAAAPADSCWAGRAARCGPRSSASVAARLRHGAGAAMVCEGDFVASVVTAGTHAAHRIGRRRVPVPGSYRGLPEVVGGGDVAVQCIDTAAAAALMRYLASPAAAAVWAAAGGFISPNHDLDLAVYPDELIRSFARSRARGRRRLPLRPVGPATGHVRRRRRTAGCEGGLHRLLLTR